jgi:hypothetical protein
MPRTTESDWPLDPEYRIQPFAEQDTVSAADVVGLWRREAGLSAAEAERRVAELLLVATDRQGRLAGVCTTYLRHNEQLRSEMWYFRAFVAAAARHSNIAVGLVLRGRDHLVRRFVGGEDRRAIGIIFEVENEGLKSYFSQAVWLPSDFTFIGENARGDHVRVHYFPGALAPEPGQEGSA